MLKSVSSLVPIVCTGIVLAGAQAAHAAPIYLETLLVDQTPSTPNTTSQAPPPVHHNNEFLIGPEFSVFFPTSSKTSDAYGKSWGSIGVGFGSTQHARTQGAFSPYFELLYNRHDGNSAFVFPLGVSYRRALIKSDITPYYGGQAFLLGVDQKAESYGLNSGFNVGVGARAAFGIQFSKYLYLEAAYMQTSTVRSFDFSGTELEAGFRL